MHYQHAWLQKLRFFSNIGILYLLTMAFAWYAIQPLSLFGPVRTVSITKTAQLPHVVAVPSFKVVSGLPVRIVLPDSSWLGVTVDLPVDEGYYDSTSNSWTLSGYRAQFMMISSLANNYAGETYIYGHNNDYVFGALRHVTPSPGAPALVYTSNGHIFEYGFVSASNFAPTNTSVLDYNGPPILVIQTCTGSFNEVRTLYKYNFVKVVQ